MAIESNWTFHPRKVYRTWLSPEKSRSTWKSSGSSDLWNWCMGGGRITFVCFWSAWSKWAESDGCIYMAAIMYWSNITALLPGKKKKNLRGNNSEWCISDALEAWHTFPANLSNTCWRFRKVQAVWQPNFATGDSICLSTEFLKAISRHFFNYCCTSIYMGWFKEFSVLGRAKWNFPEYQLQDLNQLTQSRIWRMPSVQKNINPKYISQRSHSFQWNLL